MVAHDGRSGQGQKDIALARFVFINCMSPTSELINWLIQTSHKTTQQYSIKNVWPQLVGIESGSVGQMLMPVNGQS